MPDAAHPKRTASGDCRRLPFLRFGRMAWAVTLGAALFVSTLAPPAGATTTARPGEETTGCVPTGSIWWNELLTSEPDKLSEFYAGVVGWQTKTVSVENQSQPPTSDNDRYTMFMRDGTEAAGLMRADHPSAIYNTSGWFIYFQVADLDASVTKAQTSGGTVLRQPVSLPDGSRIALIRDPGGNVFGLVSETKRPNC